MNLCGSVLRDKEQSLARNASIELVQKELASELELLILALKPLAFTRHATYLGRMNLVLERCERLLELAVSGCIADQGSRKSEERAEFFEQAFTLIDQARSLLKAKLVVGRVHGNVVHLKRDGSKERSSDVESMLAALDVESLLAEDCQEVEKSSASAGCKEDEVRLKLV